MDTKKKEIIKETAKLYFKYGIRSVTMDDIAEKMSISKKTIYAFYKTKSKLVEACVMDVFNAVSEGIDQICIVGLSPIEELFKVKDFVLNHLKQIVK